MTVAPEPFRNLAVRILPGRLLTPHPPTAVRQDQDPDRVRLTITALEARKDAVTMTIISTVEGMAEMTETTATAATETITIVKGDAHITIMIEKLRR